MVAFTVMTASIPAYFGPFRMNPEIWRVGIANRPESVPCSLST